MVMALFLYIKLLFMAQNIHQAPIVFTLNNTGAYHERSAIIFLTMQILLTIPETTTKDYINGLGYFTEAEIMLLHARILNRRNKEVMMNEKHFIIYNACFHFVKKLLLDNGESQDVILLKKVYAEASQEGIFKIKDLVLEFIAVGEKLFQTEYKNNHNLTAALAKIANS